MELLSQRPMFSSESSTKGFDLSSGKSWIYPENYPVRTYQLSIVESALYHNTLVCLPTGLGKTFIAAVVMYNFWRWYPQGKIVFLAPTKPLVAQQIHACQDIMGISADETIALTGAMDQKKRQSAWAEHRVIFATPQVFQNDLEKKIFCGELVKCVVVDEAHKALGRHAYCEAIRLLIDVNKYFRVLGLSATPGSKLDAVQEVVRNLLISRLELRDDTSPDVTPYINERKLDIVLVGLGAELERFKDRYITIMDRHVRVLVHCNVLRGNAGNISKGRIYMIKNEYGRTGHRGHNHGQIMKTLTILMTMYHAYELMVRHGLRAFYNFYQNHMDKYWLKDEPELMQLLEEIHYYIGPFPDVRPLPDGSLPEIPEDIRFGHNKFQKLKDILLRHFEIYEDKKEDTRAIVFVEYRDIVNEVYVLLLQSRPLLRPQKFIGQAGQKQRLQKLALEDFRSNKVNVLISTSVGEEGLDVGEVDLIVCFDISQVSPIRLVQRMGRTGRKRDGHIILLVTDGKEHQTLKSAMSRRDSLNNKVLQSSGITTALHETSPRMVPEEFRPECYKMHLTVLQKSVTTKAKEMTKESKKSRQRVETVKKAKSSKTSDPATSNNQPGQSSMMKFVKRTRDAAELDFNDDPMDSTAKETRVWTTRTSQQPLRSNNTIKLSNVKLLSSDNAAIEFLTLCTMKRSENEQQTNIDRTKMHSYLPSYQENNKKTDAFFDFEIPELQILDCLKNITEYVIPTCRNDKDGSMICENVYLPNDDYQATYKTQSPVADSKFEDLLDDSTNDTNDTTFDPHEVVKHDDFPALVRVDWAVNVNDTKFEYLLDEWSDESTMSLEKFESERDAASGQLQPSKFEDIMNSSSNDSDETYYSPRKNTEMSAGDRLNVLHPTKMSSDIGFKDSTESSLQGPSLLEPSETMLDDESIDLLKDCAAEEICHLSTERPDSRYFKLISNVQEALTGGTSMNSVPIDLEPKEQSRFSADRTDSRASKIVSETRGASTSIPKTVTSDYPETNETTQFFAQHPDRRPVDVDTEDQHDNAHDTKKLCTLMERDSKEQFQPLGDGLVHRHGKIVEVSREACMGKIQNITEESPSSMLTISQTLEEIECINSRANTSKDSRVNNLIEGQWSEALPDRPLGDCNSHLSQTSIGKTARKATSYKFNEHVGDNAESDEDLFETDVLLLDSDFEEQINNIERNLCTNVSTNHKEASFDSSVKGTDIELNESEILFVKEAPKRVKQNATPLHAKQNVREFNVNDFYWNKGIDNADVKNSHSDGKKSRRSDRNGKFGNDRHSPTVNSYVTEITIDDWEKDTSSDCGSTDLPSGFNKNTVNNVRSRKNTNNQTPSIKSSAPEKNFDRSVWNHKTVKNTSPPSVKEANFDKNNCNRVPENNPLLPYAKSSVPEEIIEDCDWSSDFEVFSKPRKSSKKCQELDGNRDSPGTTGNSPRNIAQNSQPIVRFVERANSTGWISADRPKLRLALDKKISRNIHDNLSKKQTHKKASPVKQDSDLENDFAVLRIETAVSNGAASNYFAKPSDLVDKTATLETLEMYKRRRVAISPLSLRKNDVNKVSLEGLTEFAAPAKHMEQQQRQQKHQDPKNGRNISVSRRKATSVDLDTRKKTHRKDRRRLRAKSEFVDDEAEVSSDDCQTSGSSGLDEDLDGFVSYTQHVDDSTDMRAHYLQTVRSPLRHDRFRIKKPKSPNPNVQIYSQTLPDEPNDYLYDSFCVPEDDDDVFEDSQTPDEITMLEEIELNLKDKKRKRCDSTDVGAKRKRKLVVAASEVSSSEDETESLRRQIQDESLVLKNKCD